MKASARYREKAKNCQINACTSLAVCAGFVVLALHKEGMTAVALWIGSVPMLLLGLYCIACASHATRFAKSCEGYERAKEIRS